MGTSRSRRYLAGAVLSLLALAPVHALTVTYNAATDVPVSGASYDASAEALDLTLNFAPATGTTLTVVNNTGIDWIQGEFTNVAHGQIIPLQFGGVTYHFVANYYGGNGNDLVLQWAKVRPVAWGGNTFGGLGDGTTVDRSAPTTLVTANTAYSGKTVIDVKTGEWMSAALLSDGTVASCGDNQVGQLGHGIQALSSTVEMVKNTGVLAGKKVVKVATGAYHCLALCSDGTLVSWGQNTSGELGNGLTANRFEPVLVSTGMGSALQGKKVVAIAAGYRFSLALCSDGTVAAWGANDFGQLGIGITADTAVLPTAIDVSGVLATRSIVAVSAGNSHALAICNDGAMVTWGQNSSGQLGDASNVALRNAPVLVDTTGALAGKTPTVVKGGLTHSVALCSDGTVFTWGGNDEGQLGNGALGGTSNIPLAVTGGELASQTVAELTVGAKHTIALRQDGVTVSWGGGLFGALGSGATTNRLNPAIVDTTVLGAGQKLVRVGSGARSRLNLAMAAVGPVQFTAPAPNSLNGRTTTVSYVLPEAAATGSVKVRLIGTENLLLSLKNGAESIGAHTFTFDPTNPPASGFINSTPAIQDGTYVASFLYTDSVQNEWSTITETISFDTTTQTPLLTLPGNNFTTRGDVPVDFMLPENALPGSLTLTFANAAGTKVLTLATSQESAGFHTFFFEPSNPTAAAQIVSGPALPDGVYTVTLAYRDAQGNPQSSVVATNVRLDNVTQAPALTAPAANSFFGPLKTVNFNLPEAAANGSVQLTFQGTSTVALTLAASQQTVGAHTFSFNPASPGTAPQIASGAAIPDGTYDVTLSYQDVLGNAAATSVIATGVKVDSTPPVIGGTFMPTEVLAGALPNYLAQANATDASLVTLIQTPSNLTQGGSQQVTITARDQAGNESSVNFTVNVHAVKKAAVIGQGDGAPGSGVKQGLPADAKLSVLGIPAIDEDGTVAFLSQWKSGTKVKGSGVFTPTECIALVGETVPGGNGATIKTLADPIISNGHVVVFATLIGGPSKKSTTAILRKPAGGQLEIIAQSGTEAPGTGGAKFKAFTAAEVRDTAVAFRAQLLGGTGSPKTAGGNDFGLWIKAGTSAPALALREGQTAAPGHIINALTAFVPGNGSPGHGRGWLTLENGTPTVLAHATFLNKQQGIVQADATGTVTNFLPTGVVGVGGSDFATIPFKTFGLPGFNDFGESAFLATELLPGGRAPLPVKTLITSDDFSATYHTLFPQGEITPGTGTIFSLVKDPVIGADGTVVFPATIKGPQVKGLAATTLWWKKEGGNLALLAQAGQPNVPGVVSGQWKTFTSLATAGEKGPIFVAGLLPGKGGVTGANATGLWAMNFQGNLHLLLRAGDQIADGRVVKSFTALKAVRFSEGVSRSFNDQSQVAILATLKTTVNPTAIVVLEAP